MAHKITKTLATESVSPNGLEPPASTGRSNCTVFLDHPELLDEWEFEGTKIPKDVDVPAYKRRDKVVKR